MKKDLTTYKKAFIERLHCNGFDLKDADIQRFFLFMEHLYEWNQKINLTAHHDPLDCIEKDIIDALYLNLYIIKYRPKARRLLDVGCGAGFSGLTIAFLRPEVVITFLDPSRKRINFIKHVCRELNIKNTLCLIQKAEDITPDQQGSCDLAFSRATWGPLSFVSYVHNYVQNNGTLLSITGLYRSYENEPKIPEGLEQVSEVVYTIKPKDYERRLLFFDKKL